ncbi:hypothetical protein OIU77_031463 [Salix suchowensis]|uniref:Uncharacterized protein n=1 Tax=Salix suchowensis TaxID=1278906 RepID=A0ABQ9BHA6_9ROSI|nr:hypothetical protein OIU77_031463 [Salix suchowensis]
MPSHKTFRIKKKLAKKMRQKQAYPSLDSHENRSITLSGTTPSAGTGEELSLDSKMFWVLGILGFVNVFWVLISWRFDKE